MKRADGVAAEVHRPDAVARVEVRQPDSVAYNEASKRMCRKPLDATTRRHPKAALTSSGMTCPGSLIVHVDGTSRAAHSTKNLDDCRGRDERHDGSPLRCITWWGRCDYCGIQSATR